VTVLAKSEYRRAFEYSMPPPQNMIFHCSGTTSIWNCDYYLKHETMMPEDWKDRIGRHDAIFFGSVGWPELK